MMMMTSISAMAQMRLNFGDDSQLRKLQIAEMAIKSLYVDSVDEKKLVEDGIRGMLEKLDPHSSYSTPKEVKAMNEPLAGNFEGIGVQFNMIDDTLLVIQPVTGGPSEKVGIVAGDRIVSVNDTAIAGVKMPKEEIMRRLRGPKGTKVMLGVVRRGISDTLAFKVTRDKIPVNSIDATYMIRPNVGYIRIGNFGATTHREFVESLMKLEKQGMRDLILDLEGNGGGYLQAAVDIANELLPKNDLIVYTTGRRVPRMEYRAKGNGILQDGNDNENENENGPRRETDGGPQADYVGEQGLMNDDRLLITDGVHTENTEGYRGPQADDGGERELPGIIRELKENNFEPWMLCEPNEKEGRKLLEEIMKGGNFGQYDTRDVTLKKGGMIRHGLWKLKRVMRLVRSYPEEALWEPVFRVWHLGWRKVNG